MPELGSNSLRRTLALSHITDQIFDLIGAPPTDFKKGRLPTIEDFLSISFIARRDTDDSWHRIDEILSTIERYADREVIG